MAEEKRNGGVDSTDLDDLYSSFVIPDLEEDDDYGNIGVISNMIESYFPPISSSQMNVNVLRRRKKWSSGTDTIGVPNPDGLLQQEENDEIDINVSLDKFLATNFQDYDNEEEDNKIEETAEDENLFLPISPQRNFIFGSGVTSSKSLGIRIRPRVPIQSTESGLGFVTTGTASRRIRIKHGGNPPFSGYPIEPNESTIDAEGSSNDDPDQCEVAPSLTGLSSQSPNAKPSLIAEVNKYLEWVFILTNLVLEILLVVLDQIACPQKPQYALTALALSLVAIAVSVIELSFKAQKQEVILRRQGVRFWFQYPSSSHKPFYTFIDVFGFICALSQFIFSAVAYSYHSRHADNPINISIVSLLFIICLASSKLTKDSKEAPVSAPV